MTANVHCNPQPLSVSHEWKLYSIECQTRVIAAMKEVPYEEQKDEVSSVQHSGYNKVEGVDHYNYM